MNTKNRVFEKIVEISQRHGGRKLNLSISDELQESVSGFSDIGLEIDEFYDLARESYGAVDEAMAQLLGVAEDVDVLAETYRENLEVIVEQIERAEQLAEELGTNPNSIPGYIDANTIKLTATDELRRIEGLSSAINSIGWNPQSPF